MCEKSDTDSSDKSSDVRASSNSSSGDMKVNVMYRGMVYRVRGIKVLCSVVTAVILLLMAIVGLGVWMLVSAYADEKVVLPNGTNATKLTASTKQPASTPFTIDFNAPSATLEEVSLPAVIPNTVTSENLHVNEAIGHFQGVTPGRELEATSLRIPAPDPAFGLFSGLGDVGDSRSQASVAEDSVVQHSNTDPVLALAPPHLHNTEEEMYAPPPGNNRRMDIYVDDESTESFRSPILQGGLPDNIPRDIDPILLDMGLPFPYPPTMPTTRAPRPRPTSLLPRRPSYPNYRGESRRVGQGTRRTRPVQQSPRPVQQSPSLPPAYFNYDYEDHQPYDAAYERQEPYYGPQPTVARTPNQPSTVTGDQINIYAAPSTPVKLDQRDRHQATPGKGQLPGGFTLPPGVTIPSGMTLPQGVTLPEEFDALRNTAGDRLGGILHGPGSHFQDMMHYYNKHEMKRTTTSTVAPSTDEDTQYSHRAGLTEEDVGDEDTVNTGYTGPPVVGYGDQPQRNRPDPVFEHFWDAYGHDGNAPARHDDRGPVPEEFWEPHTSHEPQSSDDQRWPQNGGPHPPYHGPRPNQFRRRFNAGAPHPNIRGPRPNGQGYPLPRRPDAERPPVLLEKLWAEEEHPQPARAGPPRNRNGPLRRRPDSINSRIGEADDINGPTNTRTRPSNNFQRPSQTRPGPHHSHPGHINIRPPTSPSPNHRPFLGPLYDMYDYSRRLASTLLSFPNTLNNQYNASRAEYIKNEVELLEDYNRVFQNPNTSSADILPDMFDDRPSRNERLMLIDSSKLRSLSPFEMSLITWTFLDFWEFLIEKVGTLSKEDLHLLEQRLERLRQKKDRVMTQSFMSATADQRLTQEASDTSLPDVSRAIAMAENLLRNLPNVAQAVSSLSTIATTPSNSSVSTDSTSSGEVEGRMWDPLGVFDSKERVQFMEFAIKVLFKFGRVYLTKNYALDCMMLLFCKDLNSGAKRVGVDGMAAKIKSVGLKVLTEKETMRMDTMGEIWRSLTAWETLQCEGMFPRCDGPKALEIVNDVALGSRRK